MKKLLLLVAAGVGAALALKKNQEAQHELALWSEVTDRVEKKPSA